jgi:hypothetical protein
MSVNCTKAVLDIMHGDDIAKKLGLAEIVALLVVELLRTKSNSYPRCVDVYPLSEDSLEYSSESGNWFVAPNTKERNLINAINDALLSGGYAHDIQVVTAQKSEFSAYRTSDGRKTKMGWYVVGMKNAPLNSPYHLIK